MQSKILPGLLHTYPIRLTFVLLFIAVAAFAQTPQVQWPHHKKAVIVLTYDDALRSQLQTAVPQLKKAHLKATFFLTSDVNSTTIPMWRKLAKKGYELANHTAFHPCAALFDNPVSSDHYTQYDMIREIEVMNHFLFAIDGKNSRTFAYPCAITTVGNKDYVDSLRLYGMVKYARIGGDTNAIITDFRNLDLLRIPSFGLEDNTSAATLISFVQHVEQSGGMGIIMFHGIGGDYITTSAAAHQELLTYLHKNRSKIWVATFQDAMDYAMKNVKPSKNPPRTLAALRTK